MTLHEKRFPNENAFYREARDQLLKAEIELKKQTAKVNAMRSQLPKGGKIPTDYVFEEHTENEATRQVTLSKLASEVSKSVVVYSLMYAETPCPSCVSLIDGLDGSIPHIRQRTNFVVIAKAPAEQLAKLKKDRGWQNVQLLSSANNSYNADYHAENKEGDQLPACNVFRLTGQGNIRHFYNTELLYVESDGDPRHVDALWPLWNVLDLTKKGRGENFHPALDYNDH